MLGPSPTGIVTRDHREPRVLYNITHSQVSSSFPTTFRRASKASKASNRSDDDHCSDEPLSGSAYFPNGSGENVVVRLSIDAASGDASAHPSTPRSSTNHSLPIVDSIDAASADALDPPLTSRHSRSIADARHPAAGTQPQRDLGSAIELAMDTPQRAVLAKFATTVQQQQDASDCFTNTELRHLAEVCKSLSKYVDGLTQEAPLSDEDRPLANL